MSEAGKKAALVIGALVVVVAAGLAVAKKKLDGKRTKYDGDYTLARWALDDGELEATGTMKAGAGLFLIELKTADGPVAQIYHVRELSATKVETEDDKDRSSKEIVWECVVEGNLLSMQGEYKGHVMKYEWQRIGGGRR